MKGDTYEINMELNGDRKLSLGEKGNAIVKESLRRWLKDIGIKYKRTDDIEELVKIILKKMVCI